MESLLASDAEKWIYEIWRHDPENRALVLSYGFLFQGTLELEKLTHALQRYLNDYHKDCFCTFESLNHQLFKKYSEPEGPLWTIAKKNEPLETLQEALSQPYDLEEGPLFRFMLQQQAPDRLILGCSFSHIIFDGLSFEKFRTCLQNVYKNPDVVLKPAVIRFPSVTEKNRTYWDSLKERLPQNRGSFFKKKRDLPIRCRFHTQAHVFQQELFQKIQQTLQKHDITLFHFLSAATFVTIAKYEGISKGDLLIFHTVDTSFKRSRPVGCATNKNPLVVYYDEAQTPKDLCKQVKEARAMNRPHQHVPCLDFMENHKLNLSTFPYFINPSPGLLGVTPPAFKAVKTSILWTPSIGGTQNLSFTYHEDRYQWDIPETFMTQMQLAEFHENWLRVLHFFCDQEQETFSTFSLESAITATRGAELVQQASLPQQFQQIFKANPQKEALRFQEKSWNYEELAKKAACIASFLQKQHVETVGIHFIRSENLMFSLLGSLLSGVCFVPLDPQFPTSRLERMADLSKVQLILTDARTEEKSDFYQQNKDAISFVNLDFLAEIHQGDDGHFVASASETQAQYILFTSGSTGDPKGVLITKQNFSYFLNAFLALNLLKSESRLLALTSINFDISLLEFLLPLLSGACVVLAPQEVLRDGSALGSLLDHERITVMQATPSTWELLKEKAWKPCQHLQRVWVGGEALSTSLAAYLFGLAETVFNMYGPTETTIWSSCTPVLDPQQVSIGKPLPGTILKVLDANKNPCPLGVPGELWIGGEGVSPGYLNADSSIKFAQHGGKPFFKTGDWVCLYGLHDMVFIRRMDDQVKIRGYRVELQEVTNQVKRFSSMDDVVTIVKQDPEPHLISFLKRKKEPLDLEQLSTHLSNHLPPYMVPKLVLVDAFPLTNSQKIDLEALQKITSHPVETLFCEDHPLVELIQQQLGQSIHLDATWGEQGFFSLALGRMADVLSEHFKIPLAPHLFYEYTTPRKFWNFLQRQPKKAIPEQQKLLSYEASPIAIVGFSGRFPQSASCDLFWDQLKLGRNCISPNNRLLLSHYSAGFLENIDAFEASFFHVSPLEAISMDPQQRLLLEEAYKTLEHAGYEEASQIGVYIAVSGHDYETVYAPSSPYTMPGISNALLANRISHFFDFKGPSVVIDTACSGSLVAIVRAIQDLQTGRIEGALVGAVNIVLDPHRMKALADGQFLSPKFRCATFDAGADGYVRGEGVGCVFLKRYEDVVRDRDPCHGLILSAVENHGGRAHSLTAPSTEAQKNLLLQAYRHRELAAQVTAIEAHGTGTKLGDPIEVDALKAAWRDMGLSQNIALSSVKTHIGHLEPAAGMASLIKMLLCLKHQTLIGNLHFQKLNPYIELDHFRVLQENEPWESQGPRTAGISSFGFGGSNAHITLQEAPVREAPQLPLFPAVLICLSAKHPESLKQMLNNLATFLEQGPPPSLPEIAYTLQMGRGHFDHRWAAVVKTQEDLIVALRGPFDAQALPIKGKKEMDVAPLDQGKAYKKTLQRWKDEYLNGYTLDWKELYHGVPIPKVPLPSYVFQTPTYWPDKDSHMQSKTHLTRYIPEHHVWLQDHLVDGKPTLPGVAQLCMVFEAYQEKHPHMLVSGFSQVHWLRPIVSNAKGVTVEIHLQDQAYEIFFNGELASKGCFLTNKPLPHITVEKTTDRPDETTVDLYRRFQEQGLTYGPFFQGIQSLWRQGETCLAEIMLQNHQDPLLTNLLDVAFQSTLGIVMKDETRPPLPFSCKSLVLAPDYATLKSHRFFAQTTRLSESRVNLDIFEETGRCVLSIQELGVRPLQRDPQLLCLSPKWIPSAVPTTSSEKKIVVLYTNSCKIWCESFRQFLQGGIFQLYEGVESVRPYSSVNHEFWWLDGSVRLDRQEIYEKASLFLELLHYLGSQQTFTLKLLSQRGLCLDVYDPMLQPQNSLLMGLAQTAAKELSSGVISILILSEITSETLVHIASEHNQENPTLEPVLLHENQRFIRTLQPQEIQQGEPVFRKRGTYLIIGGMGGLGFTLSRHLAETYGAHLIWVGRREANLEKIKEIESLGGSVIYEQGDIQDEGTWDGLMHRHLHLNGIIHSALVLQDKTVMHMDQKALEDVLDPKVAGVLSLLKALKKYNHKLDFLLFFSSIQSFIANPGQANYTAACTFKDAMAHFLRNVLMIPTTILNWGYWGETGIVATPDYQRRMTQLGIGSITEMEGLKIIEAALQKDIPQLAVLKATNQALERLHIQSKPDDLLVPVYQKNSPSAIHQEKAHEALERYARFCAKQVVFPEHTLQKYHRLRDAIQHMKHEDPIGREELLSIYPEMASHVRLLDHCLKHYPALLTGAQDHMSVLFPEGRFDLVEPVYRDNPTADYFNQTVAKVVTNFQETRKNLRILEIGAGTGSTTKFVLPVLQEGASYVYTDLSFAFLKKASAEFAAYPFVEYETYNVEHKPKDAWLHGFDIVIATNVLHATQDIQKTVANVHALLKAGGIALINEIVTRHDYATLTFGLTPGWWLFQDHRIPDSPLLSSTTWQELLRKQGFADVQTHGNEAQQVIVGIADKFSEKMEQRASQIKEISHTISEATKSVEQQDDIMDFLKQSIADVMHMSPGDLEETTPLAHYGIDSLITLELLKPLQKRFSDLPATLFFEYPTLEKLVDFLKTATLVKAIATTDSHVMPETDVQGIAVIGMAGLFPNAPTCDALWEMLKNGLSGLSDIPMERWDNERYPDIYTNKGGFVSDVETFDHAFFHITPKDAEKMDPQERLFLQQAYHTLEDAGYTPSMLKGKEAGVFVGVMNGGYGWLGRDAEQANDADSLYWSIANRISYTFDWHGPSMAIDTACSSSLTALHLACQSLEQKECEIALVGGANLILHPQQYLKLCNLHMLSKTGKCHSFGEGADGFVDGEGVAAVLLKPYAQALKDKDRIYGVIRGSAINAGGQTQGYTVPNKHLQSRLAQKVLQKAGVDSGKISLIEAHGTGTSLGDPIEMRGLCDAFDSNSSQTCSISSLKSNIGHLESAAGIAGLIKVLLQMKHQTLVPSLNADQENPHLNLAKTPFYIQKTCQFWGAPFPRRALLNSFGAGGANACAVIEEAAPVMKRFPQNRTFILPFSAKSERSLVRFLRDLRTWLEDKEEDIMYPLGYTLSIAREHKKVRSCFVGETLAELKHFLDQSVMDLLNPQIKHDLAKRYLSGEAVAWEKIYEIRDITSLPPYAFDTFYHWIDQPIHGLSLKERYLHHHHINGKKMLPAAYSLMQCLKHLPPQTRLQNFTWIQPIEHLDNLVPVIEKDAITLRSLSGETYLTGSFSQSHPPHQPVSFEAVTSLLQTGTRIKGADFYQRLEECGFCYGSLYRRIQEIIVGNGVSCSLIDAYAQSEELLDPGRLDACFQTALAPFLNRNPQNYVPFSLRSFQLMGPIPDLFLCFASTKEFTDEGLSCDFTLFDLSGNCLGVVSKMLSRELKKKATSHLDSQQASFSVYHF